MTRRSTVNLLFVVSWVMLILVSPLMAGVIPAQLNTNSLISSQLIESTASTGWREIPDALRGSTLYSDSDSDGVTHFFATKTGQVFLAGFWGYEGNISGDWTDSRVTMSDLLDSGWTYYGSMKAQNGARYRILTKNMVTGEGYELRTNKYTSPLVITMTDQSGTLTNPLPAWPLYGALRVSDYDPTPLVLGSDKHSFSSMSPSLEGQTIFSIERQLSGQELEFEAVSDTTVKMACYFGYEGNDEGDWVNYRETLDDLLAEGWVQTGETLTATDGRVWDVLQKNVSAGEFYNIRVNKYSTPLLIVPEPAMLSLLVLGGLSLLRRSRA